MSISSSTPEGLDGIAKHHGFDSYLSGKIAQHFSTLALKQAVGGEWLEMGPAEGWGTKNFAAENPALHVLEGSPALAATLKSSFPSIFVHNEMFELFYPKNLYDTIFASHVLEHVDDPRLVLKKARSWLKNHDSRIIVSTPNSQSIHRQIGVSQGLLGWTKELNQSDQAVGHQRVFDSAELSSLLEDCGYRVILRTGFFLKPLSATQLSRLVEEDIDTLFEAGGLFPEICADLFIVAERGV
jgi:SAM-dependent methyltransferase